MSDDNLNWTDIYTIDKPREGWNVYFYPKDMLNPSSYSPPEFRFFRYLGNDGCKITEMELYGNIIYTSTDTDQVLDVKVQNSDGTESVKSSSFTYLTSDTLTVTSLSHTFGSIAGGTSLTITFDSIADKNKDVIVEVDGVLCSSDPGVFENYITANSYVCTTGARTVYVEPTFEIKINGKGRVVTNGHLFFYAERWSEAQTWGNTVPPRAGESVHI